MRIEQLRYLIEIEKTASINKASNHLFITQQSLNISLTKLEDELGVTIFDRTAHGVHLTREGQIVIEYAIDVINKTEHLKRMLAKKNNELVGTLEISAGPAFSYEVMPKVLLKMHDMYEKISIEYLECETLDMIKSIINNEQKLFLANIVDDYDRQFQLLNMDKLFSRKICESETCAVVSENHPLAKYKTVSKKLLLKYPIGIFQASERSPNSVLECLQAIGDVNIALATNNIYVYRSYIDSGDIIGFMAQFPNKIIGKARPKTVKISVRDFPKTSIVCLTNQDYYNKKKEIIDAFINCVTSMLL